MARGADPALHDAASTRAVKVSEGSVGASEDAPSDTVDLAPPSIYGALP